MSPIIGWQPTSSGSATGGNEDAPKVDAPMTAAITRELALRARIDKQAVLIISLRDALRHLLNTEDPEAPINGGPSAIVRASEALALNDELRGGV